MAKKPTSGPASNAPPESISGQDAAFLTTLLGNLPGMAYRMLNQPDWPAEFISAGSLALTGYAPAALLAGGGHAFGDLIHPDDRERVWTEIQAALNAHQPFQSTYRIETADGALKWVLDQGNGIYDDAGDLQTLSGFIIDITDRKLAEDERLRLSGAVQQSVEGIAIADLEGNITYTNPAWAEMHGYTVAELLGKHLSICHTEQQLKEEVMPFNEKARVTGSYQGEVGHVRKDGTTFPTMMSTAMLTDESGKPVALVGTARDITAQKQAEAEILAQQERLRGVTANVPGVVYQFYALPTGEFGLTYVSERAISVFELEDNIETFFPQFASRVHPDDQASFMASIQDVVAKVKPWSYEGRFIKQSGEIMWFSGAATPIQAPDRVLFNGLLLDITEQKLAEAAVVAQQERQRIILETVPTGVSISRLSDGLVLFANQSFSTLAGRPLDEILGRPAPDLYYNPADRKVFIELLQKSGKVDGFELQSKRVDGSPFWVMVSAQITHMDGEPVILSSLIDITERKQEQAERERFATRLNVASEITAQVQAILDPDELLQAVIPLIKERFGLYYVHVYTVDEAAGELKLRAGYGEAGRIMVERGHSILLERETSLVATAARTQAPVLVQDVTENPNFLPNPLLPDTKSEVAVPAIAGGKVLGVFDVQHDEAHYFTDADLDVFQTLAGQIAGAFQNAELFAQVGQSLQETEVRLNVSRALAGAETEQQVWETLLSQSGLYPEAAIGLYAFEEEGGKKIQVTRAFGSFDTGIAEEAIGTRFPADEFEVTAIVATGTSIITDNIFTDDRMGVGMKEDARKLGYTSLAATPMMLGDAIIGLIVAHSPQEGYFDHAKLNLYATLAEQGAVALQTARLNAAMHANEERLSLALEAGQVGIWEFWPQKNEVIYNPTWYTLLGYQPYELPQSLSTWATLLHPEDAPGTNEIVQHGVQTGTDFHMQFRMQTKNGDWRWLQAHGYVTERTPEGMAVRIVGTHTDIHEQKLAEDAQSRQLSILETSIDFMGIATLTGEGVYCNPAGLAMTGYTAEEFVGGMGIASFQPDLSPVVLEQVLREGLWSGEAELVHKDGGRIPVSQVINLVRDADGHPRFITTVARDITERKQAEAERERLTAVLSNSQDFIGMTDMAGNTVYVNPAGLQMCGYENLEAVLGKPIATFHLPEDAQHLAETVMPVLLETGTSRVENRLLRTDGTLIPVDQTLFVIRDAQGNPQNLATFMTDITERKAAQIERERFATRLNVASEIAAQVQAILDPDELLQAVIPLIKERFGLYYVHVYTVDEAAGELKLRAGYGEPGRIMVERGHSIPLDREASLVATAARTKEPVLVHNVTENPNFLPNPLLPDTKSEVAVPAIAGGKVLGVFDVQHDEPHYFTQADLDIFIALAGQIATAFQNAELYAEAEHQRALYDGILTNLPTAVFAVDSQFNLLVTNAAAQKLLGRPMTDKEGNVYVEQYDVVLYETGERFPEGELPLVKANVLGGQHANSELAVRHPDGTLVPLMINAGPLRDPAGKQMGAVVTFTDMTEQRRAQEAVERARALYDGILTNLPTAVFAVDSQFNLLVTNAAAQKLLGRPMTDKEGNVYTEQYDVVVYETGERFPEGELPLVKANVLGGQHANSELAVRHPDGTLVPLMINAGPLRDPAGKQMGAVVTFTDMTEQRQAQDEALAQAARSRALLETIPDMMFLFDQEGTFLDFKAEAGQELFVKPEFFLGRKITQVLPPGIASITLENLQKTLTTGELRTYTYQSPVGEELHTYEARLGRVSPTTALGLVRDITERQHAQAERERFAAQLGTAAEIARQVGTILDTDTLLNTVIPLLKERFGLYHAQVYVREETTGDLVLRAGYGAIGQLMLEQGHRITAAQEDSLVHRAAATKDVVVANDVMQESDFMPNLLLPETRAEVAVPAMIGDQVVGVFDVQSDQINFFTEADLDVYRTLAGQIASAFQTARLFEQQKEAQQALQIAAEKTRAIFEAMTEGLVVTGMMGKIEDLNDATLRLHGFSDRDEVVGRSAMQLFERAYWSRAAETMRRAMEVGRSELAEYRMLRSDNTTFEAEMNAALLRDANGKPAGFVNIVRDITDRKRAEAERARFAAELRTAADISSQVTSILDPRVLLERVVTLMKEQFDLYHVHIYTLDSTNESLLLAASYGETGRVLVAQAAPIPLSALDSLAARAVRNKEIVVIEDLTESADYLPHPLLPEARSQVAVPAMFGDKVLGAFEVLHNQAHYFTQADLDVFRTLSGQVAASFQNARYFEEIQQAAERLREMDVLKSEFLANMSHELRTPLNSIIGYAEVMLMGIDVGLDEETLADVQAIYDNGHHLLHLINDVLDLAKIEAGHMILDKEDVGIAALLEDVQTHNAGLLVNKSIEFIVEASEDLPAIPADRLRLNQILNNLVSNAVKFTEQGHIKLRAVQEGDWICIEVEDTGIGIAQDHLDLIFERFRQVDGSNARAAEGTGLGLSITQHLVEMHHGTMHVRSQLGKGSTFTVKLPLHPPADEEKFKFSTT